MNKIEGKQCPLTIQQCLMHGCAFFNERLDCCEISLLNYNLYQLKEHIKAQLAQASEMEQPVSPETPASSTGRGHHRPVR
jgi:hypothetical protein